jgi:hypothetical protein
MTLARVSQTVMRLFLGKSMQQAVYSLFIVVGLRFDRQLSFFHCFGDHILAFRHASLPARRHTFRESGK